MQFALDFSKEVWNFYVSLYYNENKAVGVGTFVATLAAFTFLINFVFKPAYGWFTRRFANIKVETTFHQQLIQDHLNNFMAGDPLLMVIATNRAGSVKFLQAITFQLSRKVDGEKLWSSSVRAGTYPVRLEPGQQHRQDFSIGRLNNTLLNRLNPNDRITMRVTDTLRKVYPSKPMKVWHLTSQINAAQGFNRKQ